MMPYKLTRPQTPEEFPFSGAVVRVMRYNQINQGCFSWDVVDGPTALASQIEYQARSFRPKRTCKPGDMALLVAGCDFGAGRQPMLLKDWGLGYWLAWVPGSSLLLLRREERALGSLIQVPFIDYTSSFRAFDAKDEPQTRVVWRKEGEDLLRLVLDLLLQVPRI